MLQAEGGKVVVPILKSHAINNSMVNRNLYSNLFNSRGSLTSTAVFCMENSSFSNSRGVYFLQLTSFLWNAFVDLFYAPLIIGAIVVFFNKFKCPHFRKTMAKIGEVSVYMWFFHALYYTKAVRWFYQQAITIFHDINLVVLWAIVLTFFVSWLIKSLVDSVNKSLFS